MSKLTKFLRQLKVRRLRRSIDPRHMLRRRLADYVLDYGFEIGDFSGGAPVIRFFGAGKLKVGKYSSIAEGATFVIAGEHPTDTVTSYMLGYSFPEGGMSPENRGLRGPDIVLGSDVWIASNALIRSGVTIGDGAVVGLGAVVIDDISPYSVVVGNPARVISKRFPNEVIAELLELRWWDLPPAQVESLRPLLEGRDIEAFLVACRQCRGLPPKDRAQPQSPPKRLAVVAPSDRAPESSRTHEARRPGPWTEAAISSWCVSYLATLMDVPAERIDVNMTFARLGMDSVARATFMIALEETLNVTITPDEIADYPKIAALARYLAHREYANASA